MVGLTNLGNGLTLGGLSGTLGYAAEGCVESCPTRLERRSPVNMTHRRALPDAKAP